jgi:hypothetical protein
MSDRYWAPLEEMSELEYRRILMGEKYDPQRARQCDLRLDTAKSWVYFVQARSGHIKIGIAVNPRKRMCHLQSHHPEPLRLLACIPGGRDMERALHKEFAAHRVTGEWFKPAPELVERIRAMPLPDTAFVPRSNGRRGMTSRQPLIGFDIKTRTRVWPQ